MLARKEEKRQIEDLGKTQKKKAGLNVRRNVGRRFRLYPGGAGHAGAAGFWRTVPEHHELQLPDMIKAGAVSFEGS